MSSNPGSPIVVALGGNAISPPGTNGTIEEQFRYTQDTARHLVDLVERGFPLVVTHGNGPQVGNAMRRVELAVREVYPLPLYICGADTQGGMGFMIAACINNELRRRGLQLHAAAMVTTVIVDAADPAFRKPTKPIGGIYRKTRAEQFRREQGWQMVQIRGQGYRRVVPSPLPREIVEIELIRRLAGEQRILVAGGGGGIPVIRDAEGICRGVEAVIDKDRTSALIAGAIGAAMLVIVTAVEHVAVDFGTPRERTLDRLSTGEARMHLLAGQFPPGSMGPKIEAALDFLDSAEAADARVIICDMPNVLEAIGGRRGTTIVRR